MDPEQLRQLPSAPFPAPPPFWKYFTAENIERINDTDDNTSLPFELNFLRPPPPPATDAEVYTTFSIPQKLDPTPALPPPEILLFDPKSPSFDHAIALKQLTKSLLLNFLELTTVLGNDAAQYEEKMQDIERLMLNVHFVINLYRPHQAREGVKEILQTKLDDGRKEIEKCDEMKQRVDMFLKETEQQWQTTTQTNGNHTTKDTKAEETRKLWSLIQSLRDD